MSGERDYELVMSFWIDTPAYSQRDKDLFVCGVEFQMIYDRIRQGKGWNQAIHVENESRVRLMCGKFRIPYVMTRWDDEWTTLEIPFVEGIGNEIQS